jgi:ATP-dependent DNA helicase RecG
MDIPSNADILALLAALDQKTADELESEVLDFKPWQDATESKKVAVEYAACPGQYQRRRRGVRR